MLGLKNIKNTLSSGPEKKRQVSWPEIYDENRKMSIISKLFENYFLKNYRIFIWTTGSIQRALQII